MILYFSGTGNSAYAAERIGEEIQDETCNLFHKIRECDYSPMSSSKPWIVVAPTYAWRIPRIVQEWLEKTDLTGSKDMYFVMTCGGDIGNAGAYVEKLCKSKGMNYMGCVPIVMPENYIALFHTPTEEAAMKIIGKADGEIERISSLIKNKETYLQPDVTLRDKLSSGIVNNVFYPAFVHAKKFYATEACISCGKCERVCPLRNVSLKDGKPLWEDRCTHCMACISRCPSQAIEYGKHSKGLPRYTCPEMTH